MRPLSPTNNSLLPPPTHTQGYGSGSSRENSYFSSMGSSGHGSTMETTRREITEQDIFSLPEGGHLKYDLLEEIGQGTYGLVHRAVETKSNNQYAIKIIENFEENIDDILQEYKILFEHSLHPNIPMLYGAYRVNRHVWYVMELCSFGPVSDICSALSKVGLHLNEDQIAYIIKEVLHALIYLQQNLFIHRDIKGSNILLTDQCEVKLVDYGISCQLGSDEEKRHSRAGTPYWMAPEVILCGDKEHDAEYDGRCDVWSLGITMIELAEGAPPLADLHPMRALLQIPRNPPPRLARPEEWSVSFNDVVTECLTKDYDSRPLLQEVIEHPLFQIIPKTPTYIQHGLQSLIKWLKSKDHKESEKKENSTALKGRVSADFSNVDEELIKSENLATSSEFLQTGKVAEVLKKRMDKNRRYTYIGDILLAVDPDLHENNDVEALESSSEPHVVSLCRNVHKKMLHFGKNEVLLTSGFDCSKRENVHDSALKYLIRSEGGLGNVSIKILSAHQILLTFLRKKNGLNNTSFGLTKIWFNKIGTATGAQFNCNMMAAMAEFPSAWSQYPVFDLVLAGLRCHGRIREFGLEHVLDEDDVKQEDNRVEAYKALVKQLMLLGFRPETGLDIVHKVVISIILLMRLPLANNTEAIIGAIANNLEVDSNLLARSLHEVNVNSEKFANHQSNLSKTSSSLASLLFSSLVNWMESFINSQLQLRFAFKSILIFVNLSCISSMTVYGAETFIALLDVPGISSNGSEESDFSRLLVNTVNEAMGWMIQKIVIEQEDTEARREKLKVFYPQTMDNTPLLREIISKQGLLPALTKLSNDRINRDDIETTFPEIGNYKEITRRNGQLRMKHFWGVETYEDKNFLEHNENFFNPELINVLSSSGEDTIKSIFTCPVNEQGKIIFETEDMSDQKLFFHSSSQQSVGSKFQHFLTSVARVVLTCEPHFVFCFDSSKDLTSQVELYRIKELNFVRRNGFSHRLDFADFLQRYCFLAFNFDERVVASKKDAQLLMIRLGIDGFYCGKKKIFLKYYHVDFLSKFYDEQYKRIVTVQAAARRYLAKIKAEREKCCKLASTLFLTKKIFKKWRQYRKPETAGSSAVVSAKKRFNTLQRNNAATEIQRHVRGHNVRKNLSKELRFKLMSILLSPHPQRKSLAENVLKMEEGLDDKEAHNIIEDLDEVVKNKKPLVTKEEALVLMPDKVYQCNIAFSRQIKSIKNIENIQVVSKVPMHYVQLEADDSLMPRSALPTYILPSSIYDILNFYTDIGPDKDIEMVVKENIKFEASKKQHVAVHVIKERDAMTMEKYNNLSIRTTNTANRQILKNKVGDSRKYFQSKINQAAPAKKGKGNSKWPEVKAPYIMKSPRSNQELNSVISQLNNLKNFEQDRQTNEETETEAMFDFKCLLRRSDVLPTETLRKRRDLPREHVAHMLAGNGSFHNLSTAVDL